MTIIQQNIYHAYNRGNNKQAIFINNKQQGRTGNLIQQKTKSKCVTDHANNSQNDYATTCFYYIHQNPVRAGLVDNIEDWHYSSFRDYAGLRNGTLCDKEIAKQLLNIHSTGTYDDRILNEESIKHIW